MRRYAYWILIIASALLMVAVPSTAKSNRNSTAMLSANDRSRWATIRSLVDDGTYAIDNVVYRAPEKRDPDWYTIDMVRHRARDEREHYYSSKPTLLSTLLAAPYWLIKSTTGLNLAENPFPVMRTIVDPDKYSANGRVPGPVEGDGRATGNEQLRSAFCHGRGGIRDATDDFRHLAE